MNARISIMAMERVVMVVGEWIDLGLSCRPDRLRLCLTCDYCFQDNQSYCCDNPSTPKGEFQP
jgi:hypothetical protein